MHKIRHVCCTLLSLVSLACFAGAPPTGTSPFSAKAEIQTLAQVPGNASEVFYLDIFDGLWPVPTSFAGVVVSKAKDARPGVVTFGSPHELARRDAAQKHNAAALPLRRILVGPIESLDATFDTEGKKRYWTKVRTAKIENLNVSTFHSPAPPGGAVIWNILIENGRQFMLVIDVDDALAQAMLDAYQRIQSDRRP